MKRVMTLATIAVLCANQVAALSCLRPDVARAFNWASEADESYVVLLGTFAFTPPRTKPSTNNPVEVQIPAVFNGQSLGANGFQQNPALDVTLNFACTGPWCGSLPADGTPMLAFVQKTGDQYEFSVDPCYSSVFPSPSAEDIAVVEACMRGAECVEGPFGR